MYSGPEPGAVALWRKAAKANRMTRLSSTTFILVIMRVVSHPALGTTKRLLPAQVQFSKQLAQKGLGGNHNWPVNAKTIRRLVCMQGFSELRRATQQLAPVIGI